MSNLVIFDTSIFIDHLRSGRHQDRIEAVTGLVRTSAVVLAELFRGVGESGSQPAWVEASARVAVGVRPDVGGDDPGVEHKSAKRVG